MKIKPKKIAFIGKSPGKRKRNRRKHDDPVM